MVNHVSRWEEGGKNRLEGGIQGEGAQGRWSGEYEDHMRTWRETESIVAPVFQLASLVGKLSF